MATSIEEDYLRNSSILSEERGYETRYHRDTKFGDCMVNAYSNKVCVIALAPNHPIISKNLEVTSISFQANQKLNRMDNSTSGKKKLGAQLLSQNSILCSIHCKNIPSPFVVRSGMVGKLLEINPKLTETPDLVKSPNLGYIAIILPKRGEFERELNRWLDEETYLKVVKDADTSQE